MEKTNKMVLTDGLELTAQPNYSSVESLYATGMRVIAKVLGTESNPNGSLNSYFCILDGRVRAVLPWNKLREGPRYIVGDSIEAVVSARRNSKEGKAYVYLEEWGWRQLTAERIAKLIPMQTIVTVEVVGFNRQDTIAFVKIADLKLPDGSEHLLVGQLPTPKRYEEKRVSKWLTVGQRFQALVVWTNAANFIFKVTPDLFHQQLPQYKEMAELSKLRPGQTFKDSIVVCVRGSYALVMLPTRICAILPRIKMINRPDDWLERFLKQGDSLTVTICSVELPTRRVEVTCTLDNSYRSRLSQKL